MEINWADYIGSGHWSLETAACLLLNFDPETIKEYEKFSTNFRKLSAQFRLSPFPGLNFATARKLDKDRCELVNKVSEIRGDLNKAAKKSITLKNKNTSFGKNNYLLSPYKDLQDNKYYFFPVGVIRWALSEGIDIPDELRVFVKDLKPLSDDDWIDYKDNSTWIWTDAIYILHGLNPCPSASMETANTHFPLIANVFYKRAIKQNAKTALATQSEFTGTPANWKAFWQSNINNEDTNPVKSKMDKTKSAESPDWKEEAWKIGLACMIAKNKQGISVTVDKIANHVAIDFETRKIKGPRGKSLDPATIKREALAGITRNQKERILKKMGIPLKKHLKIDGKCSA